MKFFLFPIQFGPIVIFIFTKVEYIQKTINFENFFRFYKCINILTRKFLNSFSKVAYSDINSILNFFLFFHLPSTIEFIIHILNCLQLFSIFSERPTYFKSFYFNYTFFVGVPLISHVWITSKAWIYCTWYDWQRCIWSMLYGNPQEICTWAICL